MKIALLSLPLRNAEDIRLEELEAQGIDPDSERQAIPYDNETSFTTERRLMAYAEAEAYAAAAAAAGGAHTDAGGSAYPAAGQCYADFEETTSVCSCTCLGGGSCANHEVLLDPGYHPAEILGSMLSLKRASV